MKAGAVMTADAVNVGPASVGPANVGQAGTGSVRGSSSRNPVSKKFVAAMSSTRAMLTMLALVLMLIGLVLIAIYSFATPGAHWQYLAVGALTAITVWVVGYLFGFLFGIPRIVSSGQLRMATAPNVIDHAKKLQTTEAVVAGNPPHMVPSSNLAEVSDWLTKLLLGAGLVSLTKLGEPLGSLINSIAAGMQGSNPPVVTGPPQVMAAAILFGYVTLGFLVGYILTSLWYSRHLEKLVTGNPSHVVQ
jgi:hypothetical protein